MLKRSIIAVALAMFLAAVFTACGPDEAAAPATPDGVDDRPAVVD